MKKILCVVTIPLLLLIGVQLCLRFSTTRELFTHINELESADISETAFERDAYVELSLFDGTPSSDIVVYFNAREIARFDRPSLTLELDCDGVIQIKNGTDESVAVAAWCNEPHCIEIINTVFTKGIFALCTFSLG